MRLSVEPGIYARRLYERVGFRQVNEVSGSLTMLLRLPRPGSRSFPGICWRMTSCRRRPVPSR